MILYVLLVAAAFIAVTAFICTLRPKRRTAAVIILAKNCGDKIEGRVRAALWKYPYAVIRVFDTGSSDDTPEIISMLASDISRVEAYIYQSVENTGSPSPS